MPPNNDRKSDVSRKGGRVGHIARDAKTGRYIVQQPGNHPATLGRSIEKKAARPDTFIEEFTKHPVVDRVMKRLSR